MGRGRRERVEWLHRTQEEGGMGLDGGTMVAIEGQEAEIVQFHSLVCQGCRGEMGAVKKRMVNVFLFLTLLMILFREVGA